jgi:hypothetical protein
VNSLLLHRSGEEYSVSFLHLQPRDLLQMKKEDGWSKVFNWKNYFYNNDVELYKMAISNTESIQGVIALEIMEGYVEVHLVESAPHNRGDMKEFDFVGPHLFAFACKRSFESGCEGFVAMTAKTKLVEYYYHQLGAQVIDYTLGRMFIPDVAARRLVAVYLN